MVKALSKGYVVEQGLQEKVMQERSQACPYPRRTPKRSPGGSQAVPLMMPTW